MCMSTDKTRERATIFFVTQHRQKGDLVLIFGWWSGLPCFRDNMKPLHLRSNGRADGTINNKCQMGREKQR